MDRSRFAEAQLGVTAAAISGDSGLLYRLVAGLLDEGVALDTILFDVLLRSESEVGSRWQNGDYLITEEHAATATIETVISLLAGSFDQPDGGSHVVVAAAESDDHSLPARAVAANLLYHGFRVTFLGANVLASDLRQFLESESPEALVLSCAMTSHLLGARAAVKESHAVGVPVLVGGKGFGPEGIWAASIGADSWAQSGRDVPEMLNTWAPDTAITERHALDPDGSLREMISLRTAIMAAAEHHLVSLNGKRLNARLRGEIALALEAVEASLLISDWTILEEFLCWQKKAFESHGLAGQERIAESLAVAVGPIDPEAAEHIASLGRGR